MAEYRNVSGADRALHLSEWPAPKVVAAGATVVVEDAVADLYDFEQPGVWETVTPSPAQLERAADKLRAEQESAAPADAAPEQVAPVAQPAADTQPDQQQNDSTPAAPVQEGEH